MIKISQPREEVEKMINQYPQGSMQREIIVKIDTTPMTFGFNSLAELKFEVDLRASIINASNGLYRSGMDFAVFRETRCNEAYWNKDNDGGFRLKNGVSPSEAVSDIYNNGRMYATECATAMVIVYYKALVDVYPKGLFDETFREITLMNWHSLDRNLQEIGQMNRKSADIPADRRYFKNPQVDLATPEWQGENAIDMGTGKYYGHGVGIYPAEAIIRMLNENRRENATISAYLMEEAGNPNYKKLSAILTNYQARRTGQISA